MMKQKIMILMLSVTLALLCSCAKSSTSPEGVQSSNTEDNSITAAQSETIPTSQNTTESVGDVSVEVGDGIYQVSSVSNVEKVTLTYAYGTAKRSEGATAQAFGETIDFSSIPDDYINDFLPYCVSADASTIYFADYFDFYKSDVELESPTCLFTMGYDQNEFPSIITELIAFDNTNNLFFRGATKHGDCVGSIDPENGNANYINCSNSMEKVLCNTGVMLYDYKSCDTLYMLK